MTDEQGRFQVKATAESHFSWLRTRMSVERTLMSWVRTSVSLIGFGFTIVQFFERLGGMEGAKAAQRPQMPRYLGLMLIASGVLALGIAIWQYLQTLRYMAGREFAPIATEKQPRTPLLALSILLALIGLFAFCSVLFRLF